MGQTPWTTAMIEWELPCAPGHVLFPEQGKESRAPKGSWAHHSKPSCILLEIQVMRGRGGYMGGLGKVIGNQPWQSESAQCSSESMRNQESI